MRQAGLLFLVAALLILYPGPAGAPAKAQFFSERGYSGYWPFDVAVLRRHRGRRRVAKEPEPLPWIPEEERKDPIQLIVSIPKQEVRVYVGAREVVKSKVSSGKPGYSTPTGIFSILQKNRHHRSNIYSRAPMPFMQRLTWSGVALHGSSHVPNHPASHGCVRLPPPFASKLFRFTEMGAHVIVAQGEPEPVGISHPNLFNPVPVDDIIAGGSAPIATHAIALAETRASDAGSAVAAEAVGETGRAAAIAMMDTEVAALRYAAYQNRSSAPVRVLVTRRIGRERTRDVQRMLKDMGFDPGKIDGWMGRETWAAVKAFREHHGLEATGVIDDEVIAALYRAAGKGEPPTGYLYVRQNFKPVFETPIVIREPERPLGAHLFTAMHFDEHARQAEWLAVSLMDRGPKELNKKGDDETPAEAAIPVTAAEALDRIEIPPGVRQRINMMLTPGSSLAISDHGLGRETTPKGSDFIVLTR